MTLNSFATRAVSSALPRNARKRGIECGDVLRQHFRRVALRVDGHQQHLHFVRVRAQLLHRAPPAPPAWSGQTSGQWVKPKNITTTCPRKSASVRGLPLWSVSVKSLPNSAPVMSVAGKPGLPRLAGSRARSSATSSAADATQRPQCELPDSERGSSDPPAAPRTAATGTRSNSGKSSSPVRRCSAT